MTAHPFAGRTRRTLTRHHRNPPGVRDFQLSRFGWHQIDNSRPSYNYTRSESLPARQFLNVEYSPVRSKGLFNTLYYSHRYAHREIHNDIQECRRCMLVCPTLHLSFCRGNTYDGELITSPRGSHGALFREIVVLIRDLVAMNNGNRSHHYE